jgi:hypothetical protein
MSRRVFPARRFLLLPALAARTLVTETLGFPSERESKPGVDNYRGRASRDDDLTPSGPQAK